VAKLAIRGGSPIRTQPYPSWPIFGREEEEAVAEVARSGKWWFGERVQEFERRFAAYQDAKFGITCCNGTIALELSLKTLGVQAGEEVLVPAYTFIATAIAVLQLRAVPVCVDIDPLTANMDLAAAEAAITPRTRAILVVHFAGLPMDMDAVRALARKHDLLVIEDAAHSWGSQWQGKGTGAHGEMGTFSFQISKNLTSAEGGIMLTDDENLASTARSFTHVGRMAGEPWYMHYLVAGNNRLTEFQAAILLTQLDRLEEQNETRRRAADQLDAGLGQLPGLHLRPNDPRVTRRAYHMWGVRYLEEELDGIPRDTLVEALRAEGIPVGTGYPHPIYKNPAMQNLNQPKADRRAPWSPEIPTAIDFRAVHCPAAERLCSHEAIWFSQSVLIGSARDTQDIVDAFAKVWENRDELASGLATERAAP